MKKHFQIILTGLLTTFLLVGCASQVDVKGDYPSPLIEPIAVDGGLILDSAFKTYSYIEDEEARWTRTINLGSSQTDLITTVARSMFRSLKVTDTLPKSTSSKPTLWLKPSVLEFQYAIPRETQLKLFEVWIKYQFTAYDEKGQLVADWVVPAYGKTPSAFMDSEDDALNAAIVVALRDLGANVSINTQRVPEVRNWLRKKLRP